MSDLILGLDVGSTSARALVSDLSGRVHGHSQTRLRSSHPAPGRVEQDPGDVQDPAPEIRRPEDVEQGFEHG